MLRSALTTSTPLVSTLLSGWAWAGFDFTSSSALAPAFSFDHFGVVLRSRSGAAKPLTEVRSPALSTWAFRTPPKTGTSL